VPSSKALIYEAREGWIIIPVASGRSPRRFPEENHFQGLKGEKEKLRRSLLSLFVVLF
jgi:hypothetical protein